eukprot:1746194-Prymnesium_polylepis.1
MWVASRLPLSAFRASALVRDACVLGCGCCGFSAFCEVKFPLSVGPRASPTWHAPCAAGEKCEEAAAPLRGAPGC